MIFGDLRQAFGKARLERRLCIWVRLVVLRSTHQLSCPFSRAPAAKFHPVFLCSGCLVQMQACTVEGGH